VRVICFAGVKKSHQSLLNEIVLLVALSRVFARDKSDFVQIPNSQLIKGIVVAVF
jgi:hypothetical protein